MKRAIYSMLVSGFVMPPWAQGFLNLGQAILYILIAGSAVYAVVCGAKSAIKWYSSDEQTKPAAEKEMKRVVIGAIIVVIFDGVLAWVLSFF